MPLTPLSYELRTTIRSYVHPYFDQDWRFFAPTPPAESSWLIARATYSTTIGKHVTKWINVSAALDHAVSGDRLSPMAGIHVLLSNALEDYTNGIIREPGAVTFKGGKVYPRNPIPSTYYPADLTVMKATAMVLLRHYYPNARFNAEQVAILTRKVQPFSKRFKPDHNYVAMMLIDWSSAAENVPDFSIIR